MNIEKQTFNPTHEGENRDPDVSVIPVGVDHPGEHRYPLHTHFRAQLVFACDGTMKVVSEGGTWVVLPQQAVWVPAGVAHEVRAVGPLQMRTLYIHPRAARRLAQTCTVVNVTALLRELILTAVSMTPECRSSPRGKRMIGVILDELAELGSTPLHLPMPGDSRLKMIAEVLIADPSQPRGLEALSRVAGASSRNMARLFLKETGMTFGTWRRQLRLMTAISRLGSGDAVTTVAYELGYHSPSAFIAMFKRALGQPPARYFRSVVGAPD